MLSSPCPRAATLLDALARCCLQMLIIPPQLALYVSLAPEQKLTYPLAGPEGSAAFAAGTAGFEAKAFRGLGVFTSSPVRLAVHAFSFCVAPCEGVKLDFVCVRSTRSPMTRTRCRCSSAASRLASFIA